MRSLLSALFATACLLSSCHSEEPARLAATTAASFRVLTYNVQSRPLLDRRRAQRNLPTIGRLTNDFDLVGIQECFASCSRLLDEASHQSRIYPSRRQHWWSLANSGLATLGRFPLLTEHFEFYRTSGEFADRVASKGILLTRYDVSGVTLDFYVTHMQAGHSSAAAQARHAQTHQLNALIATNSPDEHMVIVLGDFNMGPSRPGKPWNAYQPLHYAFEADMKSRTAAFDALMATSRLEDASDRIYGPTRDHIERVLFRSSTRARLTPQTWQDLSSDFTDDRGKPLSDSMPLVVDFEVSAI